MVFRGRGVRSGVDAFGFQDESLWQARRQSVGTSSSNTGFNHVVARREGRSPTEEQDFSFLHDDDRSQKDLQSSRQGKTSDDCVPENKEARDKFLRRKALEKQTADKQKKQYVESSSTDDRDQRKEPERSAEASGNKRGLSGYDNFGLFFFAKWRRWWQSGSWKSNE